MKLLNVTINEKVITLLKPYCAYPKLKLLMEIPIS